MEGGLEEESSQMWGLNRRLEAYLARVKALEERNERLGAELVGLRAQSGDASWRARAHAELAALRALVHQRWREKHAAEAARDNLAEEAQRAAGRCQQQRRARGRTAEAAARARRAAEEETGAQARLGRRAAELERELRALRAAHEEERAGLSARAAGAACRPGPARGPPAPGPEAQELARRLSEAWRGAARGYQGRVARMDTALGRARQRLGRVARGAREGRLQLQQLRAERGGLQERRAALEQRLEGRWQERLRATEQFQLAVEALEQEKRGLQGQIAQVLEVRQQLAHLKMSLSLEVATYRTLLEAENSRLQTPAGASQVSFSFQDLKLELPFPGTPKGRHLAPLLSALSPSPLSSPLPDSLEIPVPTFLKRQEFLQARTPTLASTPIPPAHQDPCPATTTDGETRAQDVTLSVPQPPAGAQQVAQDTWAEASVAVPASVPPGPEEPWGQSPEGSTSWALPLSPDHPSVEAKGGEASESRACLVFREESEGRAWEPAEKEAAVEVNAVSSLQPAAQQEEGAVALTEMGPAPGLLRKDALTPPTEATREPLLSLGKDETGSCLETGHQEPLRSLEEEDLETRQRLEENEDLVKSLGEQGTEVAGTLDKETRGLRQPPAAEQEPGALRALERENQEPMSSLGGNLETVLCPGKEDQQPGTSLGEEPLRDLDRQKQEPLTSLEDGDPETRPLEREEQRPLRGGAEDQGTLRPHEEETQEAATSFKEESVEVARHFEWENPEPLRSAGGQLESSESTGAPEPLWPPEEMAAEAGKPLAREMQEPRGSVEKSREPPEREDAGSPGEWEAEEGTSAEEVDEDSPWFPAQDESLEPAGEGSPEPAGERSPEPAGEESLGPAGEESLGPAGEGSLGPAGEESPEPAGEGSLEPAGEESLELAGEESPELAGEESQEPAKEEIQEPAGEESQELAGEESLGPAGEESLEPVGEESQELAKEESPELAGEESQEPAKEEILEPAGEESLGPAGEGSLGPAGEGGLGPAGEGSPELAGEESQEPAGEESLGPAGEGSLEPAGEESPELAGEESLEPAGEESLEPVGEESLEPVGEESPEPAGEESLEPVGEESPEPAGEESPEPAGEESLEPVGEESPEPAGEESPEPVGEESPEPVGEESPEPAGEESLEPVGEESPEPAGEESLEPVGEESPEPVGEESPEPAGEESLEPVGEESLEPVGEESPEPAGEESLEPVGEESLEPVGEESPEPAGEESPEPVGEESPEPVGEESPEPVGEESPEPAGEESPEPVGEESPEPAGEESPEPAGEESLEPAGEESLEPAGEESLEPAKEEILEPAGEESQEPAKEEILEPAGEESQELAGEESLEPAPKESLEPAGEGSPEPAVEDSLEPKGEKSLALVQESLALGGNWEQPRALGEGSWVLSAGQQRWEDVVMGDQDRDQEMPPGRAGVPEGAQAELHLRAQDGSAAEEGEPQLPDLGWSRGTGEGHPGSPEPEERRDPAERVGGEGGIGGTPGLRAPQGMSEVTEMVVESEEEAPRDGRVSPEVTVGLETAGGEPATRAQWGPEQEDPSRLGREQVTGPPLEGKGLEAERVGGLEGPREDTEEAAAVGPELSVLPELPGAGWAVGPEAPWGAEEGVPAETLCQDSGATPPSQPPGSEGAEEGAEPVWGAPSPRPAEPWSATPILADAPGPQPLAEGSQDSSWGLGSRAEALGQAGGQPEELGSGELPEGSQDEGEADGLGETLPDSTPLGLYFRSPASPQWGLGGQQSPSSPGETRRGGRGAHPDQEEEDHGQDSDLLEEFEDLETNASLLPGPPREVGEPPGQGPELLLDPAAWGGDGESDGFADEEESGEEGEEEGRGPQAGRWGRGPSGGSPPALRGPQTGGPPGSETMGVRTPWEDSFRGAAAGPPGSAREVESQDSSEPSGSEEELGAGPLEKAGHAHSPLGTLSGGPGVTLGVNGQGPSLKDTLEQVNGGLVGWGPQVDGAGPGKLGGNRGSPEVEGSPPKVPWAGTPLHLGPGQFLQFSQREGDADSWSSGED